MKRQWVAWQSLAFFLAAAGCSDNESTSSNGVTVPKGGTGGVGGKSQTTKTTSRGGSKATATSSSEGGTGGDPSAKGGEAGASPSEGGGGAATAPGGATFTGGATGSGNSTGTGGTTAATTTTPSVPFDGTCATLPGKVIYIESGDTQENLLKNLGRHLRDTANITLVYNLTGSCTLTNDIYTGTKIVPNGTLKYVPSTAEDATWAPTKTALTCTTPASGVAVDLAISALFVQSCGLGGPPSGSGLGLIQGPVQAYTFVAPTASAQTAIWAEEAYYAFGFGSASPLAPTYNPWNNEAFMFIRPASKSTLVATAKNIAVPPAKWKGVQLASSGEVVTSVSTSVQPDPTIGILGSEVYDSNRSKGLKTLAFQAFGQKGAFFPDSTAQSFDKQNVRDGHYTLWSPTVYITAVDGSNKPSNPTVKYVVDLVLGTPNIAPEGGGSSFDGLADVVKVGLIPDCAMRVTRSEDGGDLSPYSPNSACTCYFLSKIAGASGTPAGCSTCTVASDCGGGGKCNHGFCEPSAISTTGTAPVGCFSGTATSHANLINSCTSAQAISKTVVLPTGGLQPLP